MTHRFSRALSWSSSVAASACFLISGCAGPASTASLAKKPTLRAPLPSGVQFAPGRSANASPEPDEGPNASGTDAADPSGVHPDVRAIRDRVLRQSQAFDPTASRRQDRAEPLADPEEPARAPTDRNSLNGATVPEAESSRNRPPVRLPPHEAGYASARRAPASHPPEGAIAIVPPTVGKPSASENLAGFNKDESPAVGAAPAIESSASPAVPTLPRPTEAPKRQPVTGSANAPVVPGATPASGTIRITTPSDELPPQGSSATKSPNIDVYPASEDLAARADRRVRESPQDLAAQLDHQIVTFLKNEPAFSTPSAAALGREDRELIGALIDGIAVFRSGLASDSSALMPTKVKPLLDMADRIRSLTEMNIPTLALCSRVSGFGVYEPLTPKFRAGVDQPVIIYCEIDNFRSRLNDRQMYETRLSLEVVLSTADGSPVYSDKNSVPPDLSRNKRHDFFVIKHMVLPKSMPLGRYWLKVSITDENTGHVAEKPLQIMMSAQ